MEGMINLDLSELFSVKTSLVSITTLYHNFGIVFPPFRLLKIVFLKMLFQGTLC